MIGVSRFLRLALLVAVALAEPADAGDRIRLDIPYAGAESTDDQTLDLYLAEGDAPPLLIFVPGGFWQQPDQGFQLDSATIAHLNNAGLALAQVNFRPAPAHRHPAQVKDVAAAVAHLVRNAERYGYDPDRVYLAGHSSGAQLAALAVLDPQRLAAHGLDAHALAGLVLLSGLYDVTAEAVRYPGQARLYNQALGTDPAVRAAASPLRRARVLPFPVLVLAGADDLPGLASQARRLTYALRRAGNGDAHYFLTDDRHNSMLQLRRDRPGGAYLLEFLGLVQPPERFQRRLDARRRWHDPPRSTASFWEHHGDLVRSYPMDERFSAAVARIYDLNTYQLAAWPGREYHAIPLSELLTALPEEQIGRGGYLVTTNVRDQKLYWPLDEILPYDPVVVVGIDDDHNLFRFVVFYQTRREYSWRPPQQPRPLLARPLGAFLFFRKPPPPRYQPQYLAQYSLTEDSFRLVEEDPLAPIRELPKELLPAFTNQNGCVSCHAFRGMTARSHHNRAADLSPVGGFALPLTSYPPEVWKAFLFNQKKVARTIGVSPNVVKPALARRLYELVERARGDGGD